MSEPFTLTEEYVYSLAPDGKSMLAAEKLLKESAFSKAKMSEDGTRLTAHCEGSYPYEVRIDFSNPKRPETGCQCMSYKHPCKHAIGLMLLALRTPEAFGATAAGARKREKVVVAGTTVRKETVKKAKRPKDAGEALHQAILAEPQDDAPRLIYADWLEENGGPEGQARAEFIRVQMALADMKKRDPRAKELRGREEELWEAHQETWLEKAPPHLRKRKNVRFHRGFFEELSMAPSTWGASGAALFANFPIYRVKLSGRVDKHVVGSLVVVPYLARIRVLTLEGANLHEPMKVAQILFPCPFLSGLTTLNLRETDITSRELGILVASPLLARLRELNLSRNAIGPTGVQQLVDATNLDGLQRLDMRESELAPKLRAALQERFGERVLLD